MGFFSKIKDAIVGNSAKQNDKYVAGLDKSSSSFSAKINELAARYREIDDDYFEELENVLIMSDVGVSMVMTIIDEIKKEVRLQNIKNPQMINDIIIDKMFVIYANDSYMTTKINYDDQDLTVILMVGVNGAGKTTTIAKLAHMMLSEGKTVMVAAGDTFRAGAIDQLAVWAERLGIECIKGKEGGDPSSVVFDALNQAKDKGVDVLICDTAGRLQNKVNLMNELTKIKNVMEKVVPGAPHEVLLVLDGSTGQNAFEQAKQFTAATEVNALAITKLDGTAKGGVVIGISDHFKMPVKYIGLGEGMEDLQVFRRQEFVDSLFGD